MFTKYLSGISAIVVAGVIVFSFTACNKAAAPVETLPMGAESTVDNSDETSSEAGTTKAAGTESKTSSGADANEAAKETAKFKDTKDSGTETSGSTEPSGELASPAETAGSVSETTAQTKVSENTSRTPEAATTKEAVTETAGNKVTETTTQTQAPTEKNVETPTEKTTEKQTEVPTEKATEKPTEKVTESTTQAHTHSYAETVTKQPTCTAEGSKTLKCSCGDTKTEAIPATGHSFGAYTYNGDATEVADGTETAVCSVCGAKDTRTAAGTKIAHVHSYSSAVTTAATCAEEGVITYTCSCGDSYTESIPMTSHSFGDYTYNDDATTEVDGTKTATCSVCGATDTVTAEGTKKSLPSWYDEHSQQLNVATGGLSDGTREAWFVAGQFNWDSYADGCWDFGYNATMEYVGTYAEGDIGHGYLYK